MAGAIFQFFFIASLVLFSTSVLNVLVAIYDLKKPGQSGILKRHSRLVFSVEVFVSLGVAGAIVSAVLNTSSYHNDSLQVICVPRNSKARFFSYTLPSQVTGIFGLIMAILFIKRMKQVEADVKCTSLVKCARALVSVCVCVCVCVCVRACVRA